MQRHRISGQFFRQSVAAVAMIAAWAAWLDARRAGRDPREQTTNTPTVTWDRFSADLSFRQAFINPDGTPQQTQPPATAFHLERSRSSRGWRTVITLRSFDRVVFKAAGTVRTAENPYVIARMESDGDGQPPRLYNLRGEPISLPTANDRRLLAAPVPATLSVPDWNALATRVATTALLPAPDAWVDSVVATPDRRTSRRAAIEASFGPPRGRLSGLDRYVATTGDVTNEMLVNADIVIPAEINTALRGTLMTRTTFAHEARAGGVFVRRFSHAERRLPEAGDVRAVTDIEMTNVSTTSGK